MTDDPYRRFILYVSKLINKEPLPQEAKDHFLTGEWKDVREFHIGGDLVVLYKMKRYDFRIHLQVQAISH